MTSPGSIVAIDQGLNQSFRIPFYFSNLGMKEKHTPIITNDMIHGTCHNGRFAFEMSSDGHHNMTRKKNSKRAWDCYLFVTANLKKMSYLLRIHGWLVMFFFLLNGSSDLYSNLPTVQPTSMWGAVSVRPIYIPITIRVSETASIFFLHVCENWQPLMLCDTRSSRGIFHSGIEINTENSQFLSSFHMWLWFGEH